MEKNLVKIRKIISDNFGINENLIETDTSLTSDLNLSLIEISDLLGSIIKEFDLHVTNEEDDIEIENINTIQDLAMFIEQYGDEF